MARGSKLIPIQKRSKEEQIAIGRKIIANSRTPPGFKEYWRKRIAMLEGK